jgi:SEC-C motif-containing protein
LLINNLTPCPCGSDKTFNDCCGKFINKNQSPGSPEQLMRSRYSAYVLKNEDYLLKSWHPSTRPESLDLKDDSTQWKKLKIISAFENKIHFVAYFTQDTLNKEKIYALTETSNFVHEKGWKYLDGENVKTVQLTKNMPCPCQSGKKYKRCCETTLK